MSILCLDGRIDVPPSSRTVHAENQVAQTKYVQRIATSYIEELEYESECHQESCINIATGEGCQVLI